MYFIKKYIHMNNFHIQTEEIVPAACGELFFIQTKHFHAHKEIKVNSCNYKILRHRNNRYKHVDHVTIKKIEYII